MVTANCGDWFSRRVERNIIGGEAGIPFTVRFEEVQKSVNQSRIHDVKVCRIADSLLHSVREISEGVACAFDRNCYNRPNALLTDDDIDRLALETAQEGLLAVILCIEGEHELFSSGSRFHTKRWMRGDFIGMESALQNQPNRQVLMQGFDVSLRLSSLDC